MRVVHVYRDAYPPRHGGIEQHVHTLTHALRDPVRPEVLATGGPAGRTVESGVPIRRTGELCRIQGAPVAPGAPWAVARAGADLFHFHMANPTGELAYLLSGTRIPAVATWHHDIVRQVRLLRLYRPFLHAFLRRVRCILVASPQHLESSTFLSEYRERCRVIPYGIDLARFQATREVLAQAAAIRAEHPGPITLFVGKLRYYKGLDVLLHALPSVPGTLLVVGEGTEGPRLKALARELGIEHRTVWVGHVPDGELPAYLHACDVFAFPSTSRMEMFGLAQLEAHACGRPVVSSALGTGVEFVNRHEETGLVVPPGDPEALAAALTRLHEDAGLRERLGARARERAHAEFGAERMAEATTALYEEILSA